MKGDTAIKKDINANNPDLVDISIVFGPHGEWDGDIKLSEGKIVNAAGLPFNSGIVVTEEGDNYVKIKGNTDYGINGLRLQMSCSRDAELDIALKSISIMTKINEVLDQKTITRIVKADDSRYPDIGIAVSRTDYRADRCSRYEMPAEKYTASAPRDIINIPGKSKELGNNRYSLEIELYRECPDHIDYRRLPSSKRDRLILQIFTGDPDDQRKKKEQFHVKQVIFQGITHQVNQDPENSIYLDLPAFIGYYDISIGNRNNWQDLSAPASSITLGGPDVFINGDPFLAKGSLVHWRPHGRDVVPIPVTSFLMKNMGINTVSSPPFTYYEPWGFASIRRTENLSISKQTVREGSDEQFITSRNELVKRVPTDYREYISSPMDVVTFFSNETINRGNYWANYKADFDQFGRLDSYLAYMYNAAKKVSPMMPVSYANHMPWYRPLQWLDILMYNSYYTVDRYDLPYNEFAKWQGFPEKPVYNKEFSSNTYLEEIYQGGRNNPVFGKIKQWAFEKRWQEYMSIGSLGGGLYTNIDYKEAKEGIDGNTSSFGIFTINLEPKPTAYSVWKEYTDLAFYEDGTLENKRRYPLYNLELLICAESGIQLEQIGILEAGQKRKLQLPERFYWTAQFYTHGGILNQQSGAYPEPLFKEMFKTLLPEDGSKTFIKQLMDTDIIGWDGQTDDYLMGKFKKGDVISVAFQKAPGEYYLTAWVQKNPNEGIKYGSHTLTFFDAGNVRMLDDVTGEPLDATLNYQEKDGKLIFNDLELPYIGRSIQQRSNTPIKLPVIQVSKSGFKAQETKLPLLSETPDQFQLWHNGQVTFGDGLIEAVGQRFGSLYGSLGSFTVMPLKDTGSLNSDIRAGLYISGQNGLPSEKIAERSIAGAKWTQYSNKPLSINFGVKLNKESNYVLVLSSEGDNSNHRNLAAAGMNSSAVTPCYGVGEALVLQNGKWQSISEGKESIFFMTTR